MLNKLSKYNKSGDEITRHAFVSNMESFIRNLLSGKINSQTNDYLLSHGIDAQMALSLLLNKPIKDNPSSAVLSRKESIKTDKETGRDRFYIKYTLNNSQNLEQKLRNIYIKLFEYHIVDGNNMLNEQKRTLLSENRESKNMSKARNLLYQKGYSQENAQKTIEAIRNDIPSSRLADCKFLPGVTRMYINRELSDGNTIMKLNKTLKYVASDAHVNEYDNNLNGMSVNDLVQRFMGVQRQDADASRAESYSKQYTRNPDYTIVRIPDAETAAKYGDYTSWCVTHDERMYNSYTNDSTGLFYFCLRNGFKNEQPNVGENCPLDSYGLSMIAVSVTMDGELNTCTCRWNHDNGGNDNIMDKNQLEELLGVNFYEEFKPYTRGELHTKGIILFDEVPGLLAQGKKPEEIFKQFDDLSDGYVLVQLNNKYNFINPKGELVSPNQWFDSVSTFRDGYALVESNNKYNFISTNGEFLWNKHINEWFDYADAFSNDYARVRLNHKWNFININGDFLWEKPFNQWFEKADAFSKVGYARIQLNHKYNFINPKGELVFPNQQFDYAGYFRDGYAEIESNNKWNFININGDFLWEKPFNQWFDEVSPFSNGYANVKFNLNSTWHKLRSDGVLCGYYTKEPLSNQQLNEKKNEPPFIADEFTIGAEGVDKTDVLRRPIYHVKTKDENVNKMKKTVIISEEQMNYIMEMGCCDAGGYAFDVPFSPKKKHGKKDPSMNHHNIFRKSRKK